MLRYIIISLLCFVGLMHSNAQSTRQNNKQATDTVVKDVYRGVRLDLDIAPVFTHLINKGERNTFEAGVAVNLLDKYYPVVEFGYGSSDVLSETNIGFKSNGFFTRLGFDINLMKPQVDAIPSKNVFFAGIRIGFSPVSYSYSNVTSDNGYWGNVTLLNYDDRHSFSKWYEIVGGLRVEVFKDVFMGWTVRLKNVLGGPKAGQIYPWYIPGYGVKGDTANTGFNYTIGYKF